MSRALKLVLLVVLLLLLATVAAGAYLALVYEPPQRALTDLAIEPTAARLARGEYLARHVVGCLACHTKVDQTKRTLPPLSAEGSGGDCLTEEVGFPGRLCPPNITSDRETGIGAWTDDEILRAIRDGIGRDGRALFPMMPYEYYRSLSDEDAHAVVAYIRTLPPQRNQVEAATIDFPVNLFIKLAPQPVETTVAEVSHSDLVKYGEHLTIVSGCQSCHGKDLAGGQDFMTPAGIVRPSNLTPAADGIVPAEFDDFLRIFRAYQSGQLPEGVNERDYTVMPWVSYSGLSDEDLRAIHVYLRSVSPVEKQIQTYASR